MMDPQVPRRLARFYRNSDAKEQQENNEYDQQTPQVSPQSRFERKQNESEENYDLDKPKGIPSMDYSDVNLEADKKNLDELKKLQEKNLVEKLALGEIEKFKMQNKRMPNSKEEEQIAENLYKQIKEDSTNSEGNSSQGSLRGRNRRGRTNETQNAGQGFGESPEEEQVQPIAPTQTQSSDVSDIKDLFGEENEEKQTKGKQKDEFDVDLSDMSETSSEGDDINQIEDLGTEEKSICPNCKKPTEKVVYCSKCGTAFCSNCAKTQGTDKVCPKCGTKIKL